MVIQSSFLGSDRRSIPDDGLLKIHGLFFRFCEHLCQLGQGLRDGFQWGPRERVCYVQKRYSREGVGAYHRPLSGHFT